MNFTCFECKTYGRPRNRNCQNCRLLYLEAQNSELIEENAKLKILVSNNPTPIETLECKECAAMADQVSRLSQLLHASDLEKMALMKDYQSQIDNLIALNKNLITLQHSTADQEEQLKKNLHEKELALEKALKEEDQNQKLTRLNALAKPKIVTKASEVSKTRGKEANH